MVYDFCFHTGVALEIERGPTDVLSTITVFRSSSRVTFSSCLYLSAELGIDEIATPTILWFIDSLVR